jgi:hypothetical protein
MVSTEDAPEDVSCEDLCESALLSGPAQADVVDKGSIGAESRQMFRSVRELTRDLPVSSRTNLLSSNRRRAWALDSTWIVKTHHQTGHQGITLQSKWPLLDSVLSCLKDLPILQGTFICSMSYTKLRAAIVTSRSIALSENLNAPGLAERIALADIVSN